MTIVALTTGDAGAGLPRISRRRMRGWLCQAAVLLLLALLAAYALRNLGGNLAARGLTLGFRFLGQEAGFGIGFSVIPYIETDTYWRVFLVGVANTMLAAGLGIVLATILGFVVGIARLSSNWAFARAAQVYVELVRNLPLLLHVLFWYNVVLRALPPTRQALSVGDVAFLSNRGIFAPAISISGLGIFVWLAVAIAVVLGVATLHLGRSYRERTGNNLPARWIALAVVVVLPLLPAWGSGTTIDIDWPRLRGFNFVGGVTVIPELAALVAALAIYNAAFIAELVRGSIESVSRGQREAATALGLSRGQTLRLVIIPQAFRVLIPPLSSQYLHLLKASSLATAIGYPDLVNVFTGTALNQTGRAVEIVLMTMAVYLAMSAVITLACGIFNRKTRIVER